MARFVVVEGTSTPCSGFLRRGERQKFAVDDRLRKMVKIGCVAVVEGTLDGPDDDDDYSESANQEQAITATERGPGVMRIFDASGDPIAAESVEPPTVDLLKPPSNKARRETWAKFLRARGIKFPDGDESNGELWAGRDDLIMIWQQASGGS